MKLPNWFKILWWALLLITVSIFLYNRYPDLTTGKSTAADVFIFLIWISLCLLPLFEEMGFSGITLKKEIEKLRTDITTQIEIFRTEIKNTINFGPQITTQVITGQISPEKETKPLPRDPMEYKILNTLFTKQVNKFPNFSPLFTFVISGNSFEYHKFREAGSKLIGEGLVGETDTGHYFLTPKGWDWCKKNYDEFSSSDQWWPEETINKENLKKVLEG